MTNKTEISHMSEHNSQIWSKRRRNRQIIYPWHIYTWPLTVLARNRHFNEKCNWLYSLKFLIPCHLDKISTWIISFVPVILLIWCFTGVVWSVFWLNVPTTYIRICFVSLPTFYYTLIELILYIRKLLCHED